MSVFDRRFERRIPSANASMFRHSSKISFLSMLTLIEGFAYAAPIVDVAHKANVHRDTARDTYGALRERLTKPRFEKWVQSTNLNPTLTDEKDRQQMADARDALFHCHENTECKKRYRAARREGLVCRTCRVRDYVAHHVPELEFQISGTENMVHLVFDIQDFYGQLGWNESVNSGTNTRAVFEKRLRHFEVYSTAIAHTHFDDDDRVISDEDDFLSIPHLAKELTDELREEPLKE